MDNLQAVMLTKEICRNLDIAAKAVDGINYTIVLRGDSTLRGHFPEARCLLLMASFLFMSYYILQSCFSLF